MSHAHLPILVLLTVSLASCGGSDGPGTPDAEPAAPDVDAEDSGASPIGEDIPTDVGPEPVDAPTGALDALAPTDGDAGEDDAPEVGDGGGPVDVTPEIVEPFVCEDDDACEERVEVTACTRAACVAGHCVALPDDAVEGASCDDGDPCTTGSLCQGGLCAPGVPLDCSSLSAPPCTLGVCDAALGGCVAVSVDEGEACDDGDPCTTADLCTEGTCLGVSECDDGDVCNGYEGCDELGACTAGTPLVCGSEDPCLGVPDCDPLFGCVLGPPPDCGTFVCTAAGCPASCASEAECVSGTYCASGACVPTLADGSGCSAGAMCGSGHCSAAICCAAGQCCVSDAQCPLAGVDVLVSQETYTPQSGFARVVITPVTFGLQTFVAEATGILERVDLMFQTPAQEGYLVEVVLWASPPPDADGAQEIAKTTLVVVASSGEPSVWTAVFEEPTTLEAGQTYGVSAAWLQGDPDCAAPCAVIWVGAEDNPYPEGEVYRTYDDGGEWDLSDWNDDLWFRVWAGQHSCEDNMCQGVDGEP